LRQAESVPERLLTHLRGGWRVLRRNLSRLAAPLPAPTETVCGARGEIGNQEGAAYCAIVSLSFVPSRSCVTAFSVVSSPWTPLVRRPFDLLARIDELHTRLPWPVSRVR